MLTIAVILVTQAASQTTEVANLTTLTVRQTSEAVRKLTVAVILVSQAARQTRKTPEIRQKAPKTMVFAVLGGFQAPKR
jgi:hypothetical protein